MAEGAGVTYADLRFAKSPLPGKSRRPPDEAHEEASDGELTYENFPAAARPRQPDGPASLAPQAPGAAAGRRLWSRVPLALLGAGLFLLATCLGLGVRYWQVSRQLEGASQRHRAESSALAERMGSQEENLTHSLQQLSRAQAELSATRQALWQSWQAGNATRRQLEEELKEAQSRLSRLQEEKEEARRELEEARSCQQRGCCPPGWRLFRWKCLWVSGESVTWEGSKRDCEGRGAQLLVLRPWGAATTWDAAALTSRLPSEEFWIGLVAVRTYKHLSWSCLWVDGSPYAGTDLLPSLSGYKGYTACITLKQRQLAGGTCTGAHPYICEKAAHPEGPGWLA